jgi:toxin ParE1/3/4
MPLVLRLRMVLSAYGTNAPVVSDAAMHVRGSQPKELRAVGIQEYRQVFFKPYRVFYRLLDRQVLIYLIADGRRAMQTFLSRRLLGG